MMIFWFSWFCARHNIELQIVIFLLLKVGSLILDFHITWPHIGIRFLLINLLIEEMSLWTILWPINCWDRDNSWQDIWSFEDFGEVRHALTLKKNHMFMSFLYSNRCIYTLCGLLQLSLSSRALLEGKL